MDKISNQFLVAGALLSAVAALLHLGCIVFGAPWYRFMGAGERMAKMDLAGSWHPTVLTLLISGVLVVWALYALSGAGVIMQLPLTRLILCAITGVYVLRGVAGFFIAPYFPVNTPTFWLWSSTICLIFGIVHLIGLMQVWHRL